jgi:hypothetical protein
MERASLESPNRRRSGMSEEAPREDLDKPPLDPESLSRTLSTLPAEAAKEVVTAAMKDLSLESKREIVTETMSDMPASQREAALGTVLQQPTEATTQFLWRVIVLAFAGVFVAAALGLTAGVFLGLSVDRLLMLLVAFTTVAGILAGFISGRASYADRR